MLKTGISTFLLAAGFALAATGPAAAYTVYVSNEKDNTISIIDSKTLAVTGTIKVGQRPRGITLTKDGKYLLVCASDDDTVEVIDVTTKKVVHTLPSGPDPELFILHPSGNPLYIANEDDNLVTVVDLEKRKVL
ncbi:MAG: beta-propeller fold lactonase family protein, partial [Hyphomicrobiales bacterium]|nr:beta-propeller fold lactonase family protein [Hyphomicrobiales bacterium]